jgi:saccharopine dehydrogenase-like NADP-dependent oxidoreductase
MTDCVTIGFEDKVWVLVIGNGGIGSTIATLLTQMGIIVDTCDPYSPNATFVSDVFNDPDLIKAYDYVINTVPVHEPDRLNNLLTQCLNSGVHYIDTNEDVSAGERVRDVCGSQTEILFAPHCGLAPGLINILGAHMMRKYNPDHIDLRVGALTRLVDNDLLYTPTWSPAGILNEYLAPYNYIEDGVVKVDRFLRRKRNTVKSHRHYHQFNLDGVQYECFPTSGGLGTMVNMEPTPQSLLYRSIRLAGHAKAMASLMARYDHHEKQDTLLDLIIGYREYNADDYVLVIAKCKGPNRSQNQTAILRFPATDTTAIQKVTASATVAILDMHQRKKVPSGFLHQHDVDWKDFSAHCLVTKDDIKEL